MWFFMTFFNCLKLSRLLFYHFKYKNKSSEFLEEAFFDLWYTLKCCQLFSSSDNKKILLTTRNVRLDSGHYATKYYCHFALDFCQINAIYRNKNSKLLTSIFSDFRKRKIAHFSCFIFQNSGHIAQRARPSHLFLKKIA